MNCKNLFVLLVVIVCVSNTITTPIVPQAIGLFGGLVYVGVMELGCEVTEPNAKCWLNHWKSRDESCSSRYRRYSVPGPIHGTCYCCKKVNLCLDNCWLNDPETRDEKCNSDEQYSYDGPVHGKCYCCDED